jgi:hypothetical protein
VHPAHLRPLGYGGQASMYFVNLCTRQESNPHQRFRRPLFYPLNYRCICRVLFCALSRIPSPRLVRLGWRTLVIFACALSRTRTCDRLLKRQLLYQLSYKGLQKLSIFNLQFSNNFKFIISNFKLLLSVIFIFWVSF